MSWHCPCCHQEVQAPEVLPYGGDWPVPRPGVMEIELGKMRGKVVQRWYICLDSSEECLQPPLPPSLSHTPTMPSSTLAYSPRASPLGSPTASSPSRRVQTRKGSICAGDPWGTHSQLNLNPSRSTSCKLTIVSVNEPPVHLDKTPPSPSQRRHHGFGGHRWQGSGGSIHSNSSIGGGNNRMGLRGSVLQETRLSLQDRRRTGTGCAPRVLS